MVAECSAVQSRRYESDKRVLCGYANSNLYVYVRVRDQRLADK